MPPRGYKTITISDDVYRRLEEFRNSMRLSSINDAIRVLLEYRNIYVSLKQLIEQSSGNSKQVMGKLDAIERILDLIHTNIVELYNACTRQKRIQVSRKTLDESSRTIMHQDTMKPSSVWNGFKEEAMKLFDEIVKEHIRGKEKEST